MEKPKWTFDNVSYYNLLKQQNGRNIFIFSDFEHNWNLFRFLNNDNKYYFRLNKNYASDYNFKIIHSTLIHKCKHLDLEKICFILSNADQEKMLLSIPLNFGYIFDSSFTFHFKEKYNLLVKESLLSFFPTYTLNDAISILNDSRIISNEKNNTSLNETVETLCSFNCNLVIDMQIADESASCQFERCEDLKFKKNNVTENLSKKIIIFVPYCEVYKNFIIKCMTSIENQEYKYYEVIIVIDGYSVDYNFLLDFIKNKTNYRILPFKNNNGPAFSKWKFIEHIQQNINSYSKNDIVAIVDGDDYLENDALYTVNSAYQENNCWVTFGNASGNFCDFVMNDANFFLTTENIRKKKWIYNHLRTCKLGLLTNFTIDDFLINGDWLIKCTDRPFVYNIIEWSGKEKIKFIDKIIYNYVEHENNSYKTVCKRVKKQSLNHVININEKKKVIEDIHIVMCVYKRPENLSIQLKNLNEQTVSGRIILHVINNNPENTFLINDLLVENIGNIRYCLYNHDNVYFGFQRFLIIRDVLMKKYIIDYVIIIDDDQIFTNDWVEKNYELREPKTYSSWYIKKWSSPEYLNYWTPEFYTNSKGIHNYTNTIQNIHYGATCGCIIDVNIFNENSDLWKIPQDLPDNLTIYNIEDLWLSYIVRSYGWSIKDSFLPHLETLNKINTNSDEQSLWKILKTEKQSLFKYLCDLQ